MLRSAGTDLQVVGHTLRLQLKFIFMIMIIQCQIAIKWLHYISLSSFDRSTLQTDEKVKK